MKGKNAGIFRDIVTDSMLNPATSKYLLLLSNSRFLIANFTVLALVTYVPFITGGVANLVLGAG